jgi:exodeoxyribonuclease VII large subunit
LPKPDRLLQDARIQLERWANRLPQGLTRRTQVARVALTRLTGRFSPRLVTTRLERLRDRFDATTRLYGSLHYEETLKRGYAMVRDSAGRLLTRAAQILPGAALEIGFADGRVGATASGEAPPQPRKPKPPPGGSRGGEQGSLF